MKTTKAMPVCAISLLLSVILLFGSCPTAFAADADIAPAGLCLNAADDVTSVVTYDNGASYTAEGTVDLSQTERNPIIERIESVETCIDGETVLTVEPRDIVATGTSDALCNGYYAVSFTFPNTEQDAFLTGLRPEKVDIIQQMLIEAYIDHWDFEIEDTGFIDAEKLKGDHKDTLLCWAGATSNMLCYSGWGQKAGFETEDDLFDLFMESFTDYGGWERSGVEWFFAGTKNNLDGSDIATPIDYPNSGRYLPDYDTRSLCSNYEFMDDYVGRMKLLQKELRAGNAIGLSISFPENGHAITCWGYLTDNSYSEDEPAHYAALFVSDSDDHIVYGSDDRRTAPNTLSLSYIQEYYDAGCQYFNKPQTVYMLRGAALRDFTSLKPYSDSIETESDPKATKDKRNTLDLIPAGAKVASTDTDELEASLTVGAGDVYLFVSVMNASDTNLKTDVETSITIRRDDEIVRQITTGKELNCYPYLERSMTVSLGTLSAGRYTAEIELNPSRTLTEAFYINNVYSFDFTVAEPAFDLSTTVLQVSSEDVYNSIQEKCNISYDNIPEELMKNADKVKLSVIQHTDGSDDEVSGARDYANSEQYPLFPTKIGFRKLRENARISVAIYCQGVRYTVDSGILPLKSIDLDFGTTDENTADPTSLPREAVSLNEGEQFVVTITDRSINYHEALTGSYTIGYYTSDGEKRSISQTVDFTIPSGGAITTEPLRSWDVPLTQTQELFLFITIATPDGDAIMTDYLARVNVEEEKSTVVTTKSDVIDPYDGLTSLREAIANAAMSGQPVTFASDVSRIRLSTPIDIQNAVAISADANDPVRIDAETGITLFTVGKDGSLDLSGLILSLAGQAADHGAFVCEGGRLSISDCSIRYAKTRGSGGVLYMNGGSAMMKNCSITESYAEVGSVAYIRGGASLEMLNCLVYHAMGEDDIFVNLDGRLNLISCTSVSSQPFGEGKAVVYSEGETNVVNSILIGRLSGVDARGSVRLFATAYGKLDDTVIVDKMSKSYAVGDLFKLSWLNNPMVVIDDNSVYAKPLMLEAAAEGAYVAVSDGEVFLSNDNDYFNATGVTTAFSASETALDMFCQRRDAVYGCCNEIYAPKHLLGDANADDEVDLVDATLIRRYEAKSKLPGEFSVQLADVDKDGVVCVIDATWIQRYASNMKAPEGIGEPIES